LKKHNEKELCHRIPIKALSKTFQDAISVTRHLGFKYLWIDSSCIIQDDEQDWKKESVAMSAVYGQADLNIAAVGQERAQKVLSLAVTYPKLKDNTCALGLEYFMC